MKCKLKIITPVHIGSGESYGSHEYYIKGTKNKKRIFARIDLTKLYSVLENPLKDEFIHQISTPEFKLDQFKNKIGKRTMKKAIIYRGYFFGDTKNIKEVREHVKVLNQVYIPGSSIKGSIKTALLYKQLNKSEFKELSRIIMAPEKINMKKRRLEIFINKFFSGRGKDFAKHSIARFLQITDTTTFKSPAIYEIKILRANHPNRYNYKNFTLHLECIPRMKGFLEFEMNSKYYENFNKLRLKDKKRLIDLDKIKESLYKFSEDYIEHEIKFASKYGIESLKEEYEKLQRENSEKAPLMRIGQGSGFLGTTIALRFKKDDKKAYELVRKITRGKSHEYEFPKTRKLIRGKKPLGWVKVIFNE